MTEVKKNISAAVIGASGYTGVELVRILYGHDLVRLEALTADRSAGRPISEIYPHLSGLDLPDLVAVDDIDWSKLDIVFVGLPHGSAQEIIAGLPGELKIIDLSADFRLMNTATYAQWYGQEHAAPELQREAVYGLTELGREEIKKARLVANPGCYPTAALLPLVPLIKSKMIESEDIIIDAKSGLSGAGRMLKEVSLFAEISEGMHAYGVAGHRHAPEIEQGLTLAAGEAVTVNFTPHLVPMNRGIFATTYVRLAKGNDVEDLRAALAEIYADEPFVMVLKQGELPSTHYVRGSNMCMIGISPDRLPGRAIILSVIDNLMKGASGQAVQNMNLIFGFDETTALRSQPIFP